MTTGFDLFADWSASSGKDMPDVTEQKWASLKAPFAIGWPYLANLAAQRSPEFNKAGYDFEPVVGDSDTLSDKEPTPVLDMFARYVWVERVGAVVDRQAGAGYALLDKQAFNARNWQVGDPSDTKKSAWAVFMRHGAQRTTVRSLTYRPGGQLFYKETEGLCFNIWQPGPPLPAAPEGGDTDADIEPWLQHLAYLIPVEQERGVLLDWLAWVVQHPSEKPNWGVLIGGAHGIGKSTMLDPIRAALGPRNVREIGPADLASGYTDWLAETKVFVVEEMHSFERKETMQRLKSFLAAPPYTLRVNPKFGKQFEIPNLMAGVFFTNHRDALGLERGDRRVYVLWCDAVPRDQAYYDAFTSWSRSGGAAAVARWLLARDVSNFSAKGRAPETEAKEDMRRATRSLLDETIEDAIENGEGPFQAHIVALDVVRRWLPDGVSGRAGSALTAAKVAGALRRAGAVSLGQVWLPKETGSSGASERASLFAVKGQDIAAGLSQAEIVALYVASTTRLKGESDARLRSKGF